VRRAHRLFGAPRARCTVILQASRRRTRRVHPSSGVREDTGRRSDLGAFQYGIESPHSTHRVTRFKRSTRAVGADRIYLCVGTVCTARHRDLTLPELNCDFWVAGTHKWLFGPRGTGVLWGRENAWRFTRPTIPPGSREFQAWIRAGNEVRDRRGQMMTPGGYHPSSIVGSGQRLRNS